MAYPTYINYINNVRRMIDSFYTRKVNMHNVIDVIKMCSHGTSEFDTAVSKIIEALAYGRQKESNTNVEVHFRLDIPVAKDYFSLYVNGDMVLHGYHRNCVDDFLTLISSIFRNPISLHKIKVVKSKEYICCNDENALSESYKYEVTASAHYNGRYINTTISVQDFGEMQNSYYTYIDFNIRCSEYLEYTITSADIFSLVQAVCKGYLEPLKPIYIEKNYIIINPHEKNLIMIRNVPEIDIKKMIKMVMEKIPNWFESITIRNGECIVCSP